MFPEHVCNFLHHRFVNTMSSRFIRICNRCFKAALRTECTQTVTSQILIDFGCHTHHSTPPFLFLIFGAFLVPLVLGHQTNGWFLAIFAPGLFSLVPSMRTSCTLLKSCSCISWPLGDRNRNCTVERSSLELLVVFRFVPWDKYHL